MRGSPCRKGWEVAAMGRMGREEERPRRVGGPPRSGYSYGLGLGLSAVYAARHANPSPFVVRRIETRLECRARPSFRKTKIATLAKQSPNAGHPPKGPSLIASLNASGQSQSVRWVEDIHGRACRRRREESCVLGCCSGFFMGSVDAAGIQLKFWTQPHYGFNLNIEH